VISIDDDELVCAADVSDKDSAALYMAMTRFDGFFS
jgi:hypothetical protein